MKNTDYNSRFDALFLSFLKNRKIVHQNIYIYHKSIFYDLSHNNLFDIVILGFL